MKPAPVGAAAQSPEFKLAAARYAASRRWPFVADAILAMSPVAQPGLGTLAVDARWRLYYDPAKIMEWTVQELKNVVLHEVSHLLRDHAPRADRAAVISDQDRKDWNLACDAAINDDLLEQGETLPGNPVTPQNLGLDPDLQLEEAFYAELRARRPPPKDGQDGEQPEDQPSCPGAGHCGGCAGRAVKGEPEPSAKGTPSQPLPQGRSPEEAAGVRQMVAQKVVDAAKAQGSVPAGWKRWADAELRAKTLPWDELLSRSLRTCIAERAGMSDLRWNRASRWQASVGFGEGKPVLPGFVNPVPRVAVVVDTSGSMDDALLGECLVHVKRICATLGAPVRVLSADAAVHGDGLVTSAAQARALMGGGGGTDFRPAFERLGRATATRPEVVVYATDGYGTAPEAPPRWCVTLWLLVGAGVRVPAEWGRVVRATPPAGDED